MIKSMVLDILLLALGLPLKLFIGIASLRNSSFRKDLKKKNFTMLIKTNDLRNARYYRLEDGHMKSKKADCPSADLSIAWSDSKAFSNALFKLNPLNIVKGFTEAMTAGRLAIEVNIEATVGFVTVLGETLGVYKHFFKFRYCV